MAARAPIEIDAAMLRRLRVDEYHRMIEAGVLGEDEHVELLEGVLVSMSPHGPPHARAIQRLTKLLVRAAGDAFDVRCQLPLTLADHSEPEPDLAVIHAGEGASFERHPTTALLVVEVASSSIAVDRGLEARVYATASIGEYWIVDVARELLEVHADPDPAEGRYRALRTLGRSDVATSACMPALRFTVDELFS
jgi:Uma2 family endonuclease